jgi:hypothetical protein
MAGTTAADAGFFARTVKSWSNFWFRPGDPTTLCLMRILAGIAVVYIHLAYSWDLQNFFGKDAWLNTEFANKVRRETPIYKQPLGWSNYDSLSVSPPLDSDMRHVFMEWLQGLPADRDQRVDKLRFLYDQTAVPAEPLDASNSLAYLQRLLVMPLPLAEGEQLTYDRFQATPKQIRLRYLYALSPEPSDLEEIKRLDSQMMKQMDAAELRKLLPHHWRDQPADVRKVLRQEAENLIGAMPNVLDPDQAKAADAVKKTTMILGHFALQVQMPLQPRTQDDPSNQFQMTMMFIAKDLPDNLATRKEVLDYLEYWQLDKRKSYTQGTYVWSIWSHVNNPNAMRIIHCCFLVIMVMFTLGLFTRTTSVLTWLALLCYTHRAGQILFGMDVMMNICVIYLMIGPSGAALSLDRWLAKKRALKELDRRKKYGGDITELERFLAGPAPSVSANFATRMLQIHFCFIYTASGLAKLKGPAWWNHDALWNTMCNAEFSPTVFAPYRWFLVELSKIRWLWSLSMSAGAVFTLMLEIGFVFLIWRPRLRPYIVAAAIVFHTGIAVIMGLNVFSLMMMTLVAAFIPPGVVRYWLEVTQGRLFTLSKGAGQQTKVVVASTAEKRVPVRK